MSKALAIAVVMQLIAVSFSQGASWASDPEPAVTVANDGEVLTSEELTAQAFRRMFGFDASPGLVRLAEASPDYSADLYGVPLSADEQAELQRRVQVEQDSALAAEFGRGFATWGGFYFDQLDRGRPIFLFTKDVEEMRVQLGKVLPEGMDFGVGLVARPLAELSATQEAIVGAYEEIRSSGIHITSTGIDIVGNRIKVGIDGLTPEAERMISQRFGPGILFMDRAPAQSDSCPETDCQPVKGGIKIVGTSSGKPCTAGFVVRRSLDNSLAVLTAGHCLWVNYPSDPFGKAWYHKMGTVNDKIGAARYHTFYDLEDGDVGLIELDTDEYPAVPNRMYTHPAGGTGAEYYVAGWVYDSDQTVGSQACAYGYRSNAAYCATITDSDETMESCATPVGGSKVCHDVKHTKVYSYNLISGDSGGPIYQVISATLRRAMGTHVHSLENNPNDPVIGESGWYTPYGWGRVAYIHRAPSGDGYSVCVTTTC